jgi:hypothetical protein
MATIPEGLARTNNQAPRARVPEGRSRPGVLTCGVTLSRHQPLESSKYASPAGLWIALWLLAACGSDSPAPSATADAGPAVRETNAREPDEGTRTVGQVTCADGSRAETGLQLIPEFVTAFRHIRAECESLGARFLLSNTQQSSAQINGAMVSSNFSVDSAEIPLDLLPGQSMRILVRYLGDALDSEEGTLTVSTSSGCVDVPVRGLATDGGLMTYSDLAIDFGTARAGSMSAPREFVVKYQREASFASTTFEGFSAAPSDVFQVIASPEGPQSPESCDEIRFQIVFRAPQMPGRIEGALGWTATTDVGDGVAEGIVLVPLYGTVIAD